MWAARQSQRTIQKVVAVLVVAAVYNFGRAGEDKPVEVEGTMAGNWARHFRWQLIRVGNKKMKFLPSAAAG